MSVYIKGNFNSVYKYINKTVKKMKYNVIKENCAWLCINILLNSSIPLSQKQKLENLQYRYELKHIRISKYTLFGMWCIVKTPNTLIPSLVHFQIASIFY